MKHKVSDLEGALLDAAVAKAEGWKPVGNAGAWGRPCKVSHSNGPPTVEFTWASPLAWSSDWKHAGPIIERERIELWYVPPMGAAYPGHWAAGNRYDTHHAVGASGPTPLIAAMRAYVASKFGEEVELP